MTVADILDEFHDPPLVFNPRIPTFYFTPEDIPDEVEPQGLAAHLIDGKAYSMLVTGPQAPPDRQVWAASIAFGA